MTTPPFVGRKSWYIIIMKYIAIACANGGRFAMNQLLFADQTALVADSEKKLCRLVSEFF